MWILPKQLISAFAQDTVALTSDSVELSQTCEQSLMRRSKPSPASAYLREWKAGNLMRLRYGAISSHSLGKSFLEWWTSSLAATRVNHSAQPESEPVKMTRDTCGLGLQMELGLCAPESASSRTSKGTLPLGSVTCCNSWESWVIERRGAYSARLKSARLTSESGSSFWGSPATNDANKTPHCEINSKQAGLVRSVGREMAQWPTASARDHKGGYEGGRIRDGKISMDTLDVAVQAYTDGGLAAQANPSTHGSRPASWATPRVSMAQDKQEDSGKRRLGEQAQHGTTGKLNPRWVETLMGLPVGWTMPSCASPVTIAPMSCASSATE